MAIAHAAATPKTRLSGTAIAAASEREPDRGERIGLGDRREVDADALPERLDEDEGKRHEQEQREEQQRDGR